MRLLGRPVPDDRAAALARVGAIVEEPRFHKHLTGRENLKVIAKRYSLGMRQRLGVARQRVSRKRTTGSTARSHGSVSPSGQTSA
jgi:ABC-2 type transport system ATP-binding protein